jgi:hypothetical protein
MEVNAEKEGRKKAKRRKGREGHGREKGGLGWRQPPPRKMIRMDVNEKRCSTSGDIKGVRAN